MHAVSVSSKSAVVHLSDIKRQPQIYARLERYRRGNARYLIEFIAEATATFFYTFAGGGSTASYVFGNLLGLPNLGSLFQVGVAYAIGIVMALAVCLPVSNGHANPAFTIYAVIHGHCTSAKGLRLIVAQIFGAYIACLLIYAQYHNLFKEAEAALVAKGVYNELMFTTQGPAGVIGLYATPGANLGFIFLNEFICDFVLALAIFAAIEPTNAFMPPAAAPWFIGFIYAVVIWGYAPVGLAANSARDVGGRLAALTLWGARASGGRYAAIAALTNIPATLLAGVFYELVFNDPDRTVTSAHLELTNGARAYEARCRGGDSAESVESETFKQAP
ncbi:aquaporin-like protein [Wolfiporia cocos MD-104 SS10]|uniref:Aquaporin-like protein n=1 Tax=Wolfiporia cocos (strain MD-104) TaxID=742152 RepID=A0A2H3JLA3_WOLCO|nr:aquaporin-like protein [Wolfiporia cocos MD-104 SS10]